MERRKNFAFSEQEKRKLTNVLESCTTTTQVFRFESWFIRIWLARDKWELDNNGWDSFARGVNDEFREKMDFMINNKLKKLK